MQPNAPIINPHPDPNLIALLAGETICRTCNGRGQLQVANERAGRTCPMCRGTGLRTHPAPDPRPF